MQKEKFDVQGMTCSSCQAHVEKAVKKIDGIKTVNVNLLLNNMIVEYDEEKVSNDKIIKAVVDAGYSASLITNNQKNNKENKFNSNSTSNNSNATSEIIKKMKHRLIISICFWIPLMYIAMHHMFYMWLGIPIPKIIKKLFDGTENAIFFGFTQFLLLLPIMYVNRNYYINGFKQLFKRTPNMDSLIAIGSSAAILYGIYAIYMIGYGLGNENIEIVEKYSNDLYFESAGTILTLITVRKVFRDKIQRKDK